MHTGSLKERLRKNPAHIDCAKRLREIGAQFLRRSGRLVEIYFWGSGCAICHDSYKGPAYVTGTAVDMPVASRGLLVARR